MDIRLIAGLWLDGFCLGQSRRHAPDPRPPRRCPLHQPGQGAQ